MSVFLSIAEEGAFLCFRRSQLRVCAPVEFRHINNLIRLRVSRKVSIPGHHVVGLSYAVIDVIHQVVVIIPAKCTDTVNKAAGRFHHIIKLDYGTRRKPKLRKISIRSRTC